jgi:hypothetical protein
MRYFFEPETPDDSTGSERIRERIKKKKYKDTPFVVFKNTIGKMWSVWLMCEDGEHFYPVGSYWTKSSAVKDIENGEIFKDIRDDYKQLGKIVELINKYEKK